MTTTSTASAAETIIRRLRGSTAFSYAPSACGATLRGSQRMARQRLVSGTPVLATTEMGPHERDRRGGPCRPSIAAESVDIRPQVDRFGRSGHRDVRFEPLALLRCCTDPPTGGCDGPGKCAHRRDIARAADPEGALAEPPSPGEPERQHWVSGGGPSQTPLQVRHSGVVDLTVERQSDVPRVGCRPAQRVVAMRCDGSLEVGHDLRGKLYRREQSH